MWDDNLEISEITKTISKEYSNLPKEDINSYYFALAFCQWKC